MVKRFPIIPTVRVVHVCPPILVHTSLSDFQAVVQELTGEKAETSADTCMTGCICHEHLSKFKVSEGTLSSSFEKRSPKEDFSCALANDHSTLLESLESCNACTMECNPNNNCLLYEDEQVGSYGYCFEGLIDELCSSEALSVISNDDFRGHNWKTTSSYNNCISGTTTARGIECLVDTWTSGQQCVHPKLMTSKLMAGRIQKRPSKKAKLIHVTQQRDMEQQHQVSYIGGLSHASKENIGSKSNQYSSLSTSDYEYSDYLHAKFNHLLQSFEESRTQASPLFVCLSP